MTSRTTPPQCASGSVPETFEELFQELYRSLVGTATFLVGGDTGLAEQLCQETFLKAYERFGSLGNARGFLYVTLLNMCRDEVRLIADDR